MNDLDEYDVIVIGGSAAGLSAALVLTRARRRVAVIDSGEPRNAPAAHMQGFLSRDGMPPSDLVAAGRAEVRRYGGLLVEDVVIEVFKHDRPAFPGPACDRRPHKRPPGAVRHGAAGRAP